MNHTHTKVQTSFKNEPYFEVKYSYVPYTQRGKLADNGVAIIETRLVQAKKAELAYSKLCKLIGREPVGNGVTKLSVRAI